MAKIYCVAVVNNLIQGHNLKFMNEETKYDTCVAKGMFDY